MLARCGDALADVLTGRARALDLLFAAAEPSSDVRPAAATSISSVKAATWRRTPSASAASLRPETASTDQPDNASTTGSTGRSGAASSTTCTLVPEKPNELTPATRRPSPRSEEHTSELQSLMRLPNADFSLKP